MGQRKREQAELQALNRLIWGDAVYDRHLRQSKAERTARRARRRSAISIVLGIQLLVAAAVLMVLPHAAFAHTSAINISCTQVEFNFQNFPDGATVAHETISIDGGSAIARDFTVNGPQATDVATITIGSGTHTVNASDSWTSSIDGDGSAQAQQTLSDCVPPTTSTTGSTTTTVAPTTTMGPTTTMAPTTSTTTATPVTPLGSTSTTAATPVTPLGSTSPQGPITTFGSPTTTPARQLANTGSSSNKSLAAALAMIGFGLLAAGLGRRRSITIPH